MKKTIKQLSKPSSKKGILVFVRKKEVGKQLKIQKTKGIDCPILRSFLSMDEWAKYNLSAPIKSLAVKRKEKFKPTIIICKTKEEAEKLVRMFAPDIKQKYSDIK
jgi:nitrogen regulatory protein PII-like uncharacterized protein